MVRARTLFLSLARIFSETLPFSMNDASHAQNHHKQGFGSDGESNGRRTFEWQIICISRKTREREIETILN